MAQIELHIRSKKYLKDQNYQFLVAIDNHKNQKETINIHELYRTIQIINHRISSLDRQEAEEWRNNQSNKVFQLSKSILKQRPFLGSEQGSSKGKVRVRALKQHLRVLVFICNKKQIDYNKKQIMRIIKEIYFSEYGQEVFPYFRQVGYSTNQFQIIEYQQSKFFTFCCCWNKD